MLYALVWIVFAGCVVTMSYATTGLIGWHGFPMADGVGERMAVFSMAISVFISGPILASLFESDNAIST